MPGRSPPPTLPGAALSRPGPPITSHAGGAATGRAGAFPGPSSRDRRGGRLVALPRGAEPCEVLGRPEPHGALHEREAGVGRDRLWCDDRRGSAPRRHGPRGHGARSLRRGCRRRPGFCRAGRPGRRRAAAWGTSNRECGSHRRCGLASSPHTPGRVVRECSQPNCERYSHPGASRGQREGDRGHRRRNASTWVGGPGGPGGPARRQSGESYERAYSKCTGGGPSPLLYTRSKGSPIRPKVGPPGPPGPPRAPPGPGTRPPIRLGSDRYVLYLIEVQCTSVKYNLY